MNEFRFVAKLVPSMLNMAMRVLLITDGVYPVTMGGMQKHSYYLAKFLSQKGIDVLLVHCTPNANTVNEKALKEFEDFNHEKISFLNLPFPELPRYPGHYVRRNKHYSTLIYNKLKDRLNDFDLIYCQGFTAWEFVHQKNKGNISIPIISNLHGYEMFQKAPSAKVKIEHLLLRGIAKKVSIDADYVFSFGGMITRILKDMGVSEKRILESPIGIEQSWLQEDALHINAPRRKFVFVGRNERRKGIIELSQALEQLTSEAKIAFEFHFIGDIPEAQRVSGEHIIYHGKLAGEEKIQKILRGCDVLVVPSYSEGMPTVIMEAMASGLAIIGSRVGAISKQVDENGWLIEDSKVSSIKAAIESAAQIAPEALLKKKELSLEKVKKQFLWDQVIQHKIDCFSQAIREFNKEHRKTNKVH